MSKEDIKAELNRVVEEKNRRYTTTPDYEFELDIHAQGPAVNIKKGDSQLDKIISPIIYAIGRAGYIVSAVAYKDDYTRLFLRDQEEFEEKVEQFETEPTTKEVVEEFADQHPVVEGLKHIETPLSVGDDFSLQLSLSRESPGQTHIGPTVLDEPRTEAGEYLTEHGYQLDIRSFEEYGSGVNADIVLGVTLVEA